MIRCSTCYYLRFRTNGSYYYIRNYYCVITGNDVTPYDCACQSYKEADEVWKRDAKDGKRRTRCNSEKDWILMEL